MNLGDLTGLVEKPFAALDSLCDALQTEVVNDDSSSPPCTWRWCGRR